MNIIKKRIFTALPIAVACIGLFSGFHSLDNGEWVVVKSFTGHTRIIDKPTWFVNFGTEEYYPDYMTLDFGGDGRKASLSVDPMGVKYAEGGLGTILGNVQVQLPLDLNNRMKLHEKFGSKGAFIGQLILNATGEALTFTAGLMESQDAYMTHRAQFRTYAKDQLTNGLYQTRMESQTRTDTKGDEVVTFKAVPLMKDGKYLRQDVSPLADFGIRVTQFNIQDWNFEKATMNRIAEKRDAENKVITSRARTETAEQEKKEAEALAEKNKAVKQGEAEARAAVDIVYAERDKQLAVIKAQKQVDVAKELERQRSNELAAAKLEAQSIDVMSKAQAAAKDRLIAAGGELSAEQKTQIEINKAWADAYARKAVPQYNVGDSAMGDSSMDATQSAMQTLSLKAVQQMINGKQK